jgi:hypothetical protein
MNFEQFVLQRKAQVEREEERSESRNYVLDAGMSTKVGL